MSARLLYVCALVAACVPFSSSARAAEYVEMSGQELYMRFCASCHGIEGRGDGPVAPALAVEVPDLTLIARRRGSFPRDLVARIIDGRHIISAHGTRTMPVWGLAFSRAELDEQDTRIITRKLTDYLAQLQRPVQRSDGQ